MRLTFALLFILTASSAFAGPKKIHVTVHSDPEGAAVYANDAHTYIGLTPLRLDYEHAGDGDCQPVQGLKLQWASGATTEATQIQICRHLGTSQFIRFPRPSGAPGLATDLQIALQRESLQLQRDALAAAAWRDAAPAKPTYCYSTRVFSQLYTSCY